MSNQFKILSSRLLTRFGDQAWDFAIPLVLISIFPGHIQYIAVFYLISKIAQFFLNPLVLKWIDHLPRLHIYKIGIGSQTLSVVCSWALIFFFNHFFDVGMNFTSWFAFAMLSLLGIIGSLGATLMEISVGYDLAADTLPEESLGIFNSRLKRIDLLTEVTAPVFAGLVLMLNSFPYLGFTLIALLNVFTFIPEYFLLNSVQGIQKKLNNAIKSNSFLNPIQELKNGFHHFKDKQYVVPMVAYSFLWLSVLSPHGVLLSGYLKDISHMTELQISIFRGLGAFFGLIPTFAYPYLQKNLGMVRTGKILIGLQAFCVFFAALFFEIGSPLSLQLFLLCILVSRIGLYGFSIAESEARQKFIPIHNRGLINGVGVSLTSIATLLLFAIGSLLSSSEQFNILVWISSISVLFGFLILLKWRE